MKTPSPELFKSQDIKLSNVRVLTHLTHFNKMIGLFKIFTLYKYCQSILFHYNRQLNIKSVNGKQVIEFMMSKLFGCAPLKHPNIV